MDWIPKIGMREATAEIERLNALLLGSENLKRGYFDEIERLRAALAKYGLHTWECAYNDSKGERPCDCGWDAFEQSAQPKEG